MDNETLLNAIQGFMEGFAKRVEGRIDLLEKELETRRATPKTLDDRPERLTDRHEALTQSLEIMQLEGRQLQRTVASLGRRVDDLLTLAAQHEERLHRLEGGRS